MSKPTGGPAFPYPPTYTTVDMECAWGGNDGMTLRDWFAGQALASGDLPCRLETTPGQPRQGSVAQLMAEDAYAIADAMIAERSREA